MGTFCFDQYDHPLLWCDEKKRFVERQNADESIQQWRQKKAQESFRKDQDKREILDMNAKHCPWGRPGGGAPNLDIRRRDITANGLHSTPGIKIIPGLRGSAFPSYRFNNCDIGGDFSRGTAAAAAKASNIYKGYHQSLPPATPGTALLNKPVPPAGHSGCAAPETGAEIRSAADRLYISLKDHPSMSFRNKGHVDIELRYKTMPKGKKMLETIVVTEQEKCPHSMPPCKPKLKKLEPKDDPWGKAGPGGKPWRSQKSVGSSFMRSLGWTNKDLMKELDDQNPSKKSNVKSLPKKQMPKGEPELSQCCELCTCKCPAMKLSLSPAKKLPTKKVTIPKAFNDKKSPARKIGSSGVGVVTSYSTPAKDQPSHEMKICPRYLRTCVETTNGNQGVELVPLLARRRGTDRPISLSSTDVTKRTPDNRWTNYDVDYLNELSRQMSQKRRRNNYTNLHDRELCNTHFDTFDTFWGRPGHGAPRDIKTKLNLDDLLYGLTV